MATLRKLRDRLETSAPRFAAIAMLTGSCLLLGAGAQAQDMGYMRIMTPVGQVPGESTDAAYPGWIPLRQAILPSAREIAELNEESQASAADAKPTTAPNSASGSRKESDTVVHKPVVIVKDVDKSSLALLGASTSHRHFNEVDIVITKNGDQPQIEYKLIDATIISVRSGGTSGGTEAPGELVRFNYAKIEIVQ
jgi:type VI protein secretion system component Hcp